MKGFADEWNALVTAFKTTAADDAATLAQIRGEFYKLSEFIYEKNMETINDWTENTLSDYPVHPVTNKAQKSLKAFVLETITNVLTPAFISLNQYNHDYDFLGDNAKTPMYLDEDQGNTIFVPAAAEWVDNGNGVFDTSKYGNGASFDAAPALAKIYPYAGATKAIRIANMKNALVHLTGVYKKLQGALESILAEARAMEQNFQNALMQQFPVYKNLIQGVNSWMNVLPPSGAVVGVYASVDRNRGVWKAPANVSLNAVAGLTVPLDSRDQEGLNVDANAGKSINAIRFFTGKGVLVWGSRTLAGNDNEWRYVPVRRFFNMVEESVRKSTAWAVFEPNDSSLWVRVKAMIENYLIQKWREGALAGAKPEHAFFVNVGLGSTMSAQDILEGRLIVEIGMAAVRPAEFIILRFSHKMQES
jgi:hypothetical protein